MDATDPRQLWTSTSLRVGELAHSPDPHPGIQTLVELQALHLPRTWSGECACAECGQTWPCTTYRLIAERVGTLP